MARDIRGSGPTAERLRAFVRERVRKDGAHYERGNAKRLAEHLGIDQGWVTEYTDTPPQRNADIDMAIGICAFFGTDLRDFSAHGPRLSLGGSKVALSTIGGNVNVGNQPERAHLREIAVLKTRIARLEIALLKVRDGARDLAKLASVRGQGQKAARRRA